MKQTVFAGKTSGWGQKTASDGMEPQGASNRRLLNSRSKSVE